MRITPITVHPLGSTTATGTVREWEIHTTTGVGDVVPSLSPFGWHTAFPNGETIPGSAPTMIQTAEISRFYTESRALILAGEPNREYERLCKLRRQEQRDRKSGRIYTAPVPLSFYVGTDQSVSVGASRSGQSPLWHRQTFTYRTRDGVVYFRNVLAIHATCSDSYTARTESQRPIPAPGPAGSTDSTDSTDSTPAVPAALKGTK